MTLWCGEPWPSREDPAPVCADPALQQPVPVGERCIHCTTPIAAGDAGEFQACLDDGATAAVLRPVHRECQLRAVVGNVWHLRGQCRFVGDCQNHGGTYREQALDVWAYFEAQSAGGAR
jgi:hypothetical protein